MFWFDPIQTLVGSKIQKVQNQSMISIT